MIQKTGIVTITDDGITASDFHVTVNAHGGSLAVGYAGSQEDILQWIEVKVAEARLAISKALLIEPGEEADSQQKET